MAVPTRCLKYLLLVFTVIYAVTGLALVVLVGLNLGLVFDYRSVLPPAVLQCIWVTAAMGLVTMLVALLGWFGATKQNRSLLIGFAVLLVLVVVVQLAMAVWALVIRVQFQEAVPPKVEAAFVARESNKLWDSMQSKMQCCAVDGPGDYRGTAQVPWSCCASDTPHEGSCHRLYQRGCILPLTDFVALQLARTAAYAAVASLLQVGGAFLAVWFSNSMANEKRRSNV